MLLAKLRLPVILLMLAVTGLIMLAFPASSWDAAVRGLSIWWDVLFPSLFPFLVVSEVLLGFGIVHFLGKLMDPFMKPLFNIPGSGGFVAAMGFAAGYPVSAKLTAKIREQGLISREEGERLVSFTTSSDPIFLIGAVSVGFFHNSKLAGLLALAHYGGSIIIGLLMRFYGRKPPAKRRQNLKENLPLKVSPEPAPDGKSRLKSAILAMHEARLEDGRDLGELLLDAITSSLKLMTVIGGLVVLFSVFLETLTVSHFMDLLYGGLRQILPAIGLPQALSEPFMSGLFEVTLGSKHAAAASVPLMYKAAAAAFVLSWAGLSVHAQVASILNTTDLRYFPFFIARSVHSILSTVLVFCIWPLFGLQDEVSGWIPASGSYTFNGWEMASVNFKCAVWAIAGLLILSIFAMIIQRINRRVRKK